jgi:conjugative transfer signal peptidase TraF
MLTGLVAGVVLIAASTLPWPLRLVYNRSESEPLGWYLIRPVGALQLHDLVVARLPETTATLADKRRYLPHGVPILKEIGALEEQIVCVREDIVSINGASVARVRERDGAGRQLDAWIGCRPLAADEIFLLGRHSEASFDGRYFGPVTRDAVIGVAVPLWTW